MVIVNKNATFEGHHSPLSIPFRSATIMRVLGIIAVILILAGIAVSLYRVITGNGYALKLVRQFELLQESNIPTYFSSFLLLLSSGLLGIIAISKTRKHDVYSTHWSILSIIFLCLSLDEAAGLHELLIEPLRRTLHLSGFLYFSWVIAGFVFVFVLFVLYLRFLFSLPSRTRYYFLIAACFIIGGAIGLELVGGYYIDIHHKWDFTYGVMTVIEEAFEMFGALLFIKALLEYIEENIKEVVFSFARN